MLTIAQTIIGRPKLKLGLWMSDGPQNTKLLYITHMLYYQ